jgi:hypothetical protein
MNKIALKKNEEINEMFKLYDSLRDMDNEYVLNINGNKVHSNTSLISLQKNTIYKNKTHFYDKNQGLCKSVLRNKTLKRFHPNHINNKQFWSMAKTKYPLLSVCGCESKDIDDCNEQTLGSVLRCGALQHICDYFKVNTFMNILEIGYGHGNLYYWLDGHFNKKFSYTGIDYYKNERLENLDQFKIIEKSGIPDYVSNDSLDIVYSYNVLQHCSQKDRNDYFMQSYSKLKSNGIFIGAMFMETDENTDKPYWGYEDVNGRKYCGFFNQFTEVDTMDEFKTIVTNIGYNILEIKNNYTNHFSFVLRK